MRISRNAKSFRNLAALAVMAGPMTAAMATNGMLMEGYGPISTGMGGASQSFDNGTAGMAQNPATLALMGDGSHLDLAVGFLGPKVTSSMQNRPDARSGGTLYAMPALGYTTRRGALTYGIGVYAQGGMGTEYDADSFLAMGTGERVRSELGVGNVIIPVAYQVTPDFAVGATLDYMWATLDMKIAKPDRTRIDFSDNSKFTGAAKATGFGAKLGATFKVNQAWSLGASYHFKSMLDDVKTGATTASMTMPDLSVDKGRITVIDFQMPAVLAVGASWQANPSLLVAGDLKSIRWAEVMKSFKMRYDSSTVSMELPPLMQNWKDQAVLNLGVAWKANDKLTLRAGLNLADNPIPDATVNPLFPAIVKSHATFGLGYKTSPVGEFNAALTLAPTSTVTSGTGVTISHSQTNLQLMYSHRF